MKRAVIVVLGVCLIVGSHLRAQSGYEPVHTFSGNKGRPVAGLVLGPDGRLYGTTELGGFHGKGAVFATNALGDAEVLHEFSGLTESCRSAVCCSRATVISTEQRPRAANSATERCSA